MIKLPKLGVLRVVYYPLNILNPIIVITIYYTIVHLYDVYIMNNDNSCHISPLAHNKNWK